MMKKYPTYSELKELPDFLSRFNYLKLNGSVGMETFGFDRYLNQAFYKSPEWKRVRRDVIIRDEACDLGTPGCPIGGTVIVHHMIPLTVDDILNRNPILFDPEYLISVSDDTHKAIHYSDESLLRLYKPIERRANDTCPWRK